MLSCCFRTDLIYALLFNSQEILIYKESFIINTMEFKIEKLPDKNYTKYPTEDIMLAQEFTKKIVKEMGTFIQGVIVFGSSARKKTVKESDLDILIVGNDLDYKMSEALIEGYKIIVDKIIADVSTKLHITSMTYTNFWEHVRNGDPVVINILRDGYPLIDSGFFRPLQDLLRNGRIRPSEESVWRYFGRAPRTLQNSRWHLMQATLDLYWAVIDSAHAALMRANIIPPSPEHVAEMLDKCYVQKKKLHHQYVNTMNKFYQLSKDITHKKIDDITGEQYERLYLEADDFVKKMRVLIEKNTF
jgi:predicted nucleotidyltransferase/uncharacterized protein (UPF0332 family)